MPNSVKEERKHATALSFTFTGHGLARLLSAVIGRGAATKHRSELGRTNPHACLIRRRASAPLSLSLSSDPNSMKAKRLARGELRKPGGSSIVVVAQEEAHRVTQPNACCEPATERFFCCRRRNPMQCMAASCSLGLAVWAGFVACMQSQCRKAGSSSHVCLVCCSAPCLPVSRLRSRYRRSAS